MTRWQAVVLGATLVLHAPVAASQTPPADALERAARRYRTAVSVRATFEQTLTSPDTKSSRLAAGEFLQRGKNHFALRFTDPVGDAIVNDGEFVWVYLPSTAKGQVMQIPQSAGAGLDFFSELLTAPREHYEVATRPDETISGHATSVFALTPRKATAPFTRATLWVGTNDAALWQLETVEPSGLVRRLHFSSVRFDVALPKGALTFAVPPGVRVIDQAAMLGGKP